MMEISQRPANEIARRSMSISVDGVISSKSRASVKYGLVSTGRENKIPNMTRVQLRSQKGSSS